MPVSLSCSAGSSESTRWPMAGPFIDYLSRCSFLLQEGISVADVCFYQGDGAPAFHPL